MSVVPLPSRSWGCWDFWVDGVCRNNVEVVDHEPRDYAKREEGK